MELSTTLEPATPFVAGQSVVLPQLTPYEDVTPEEPVAHFIEGNSSAITLSDLTSKCVVPVWGTTNELTISHQAFIEAVNNAAQTVFSTATIHEPEIRVSHAQHGRTPDALHIPANQLTQSQRTLYYQRMCFCIVLSITDTINGNEAKVVVGGVRALNNENLGTRPAPEKFKIFCGWKVSVCSNLCVFGQCFIDKLEALSQHEIYAKAVELFAQFDPLHYRQRLEMLGQVRMTVEDFTHVAGKMRLYEAMNTQQRNLLGLPNQILGDQVWNAATRGLISNPNFKIGDDSSISMWQFLNLLTEACKNSYIDKFLARDVNALETSYGITAALTGMDTPYKWFIQ